jgi:hypothetical protein
MTVAPRGKRERETWRPAEVLSQPLPSSPPSLPRADELLSIAEALVAGREAGRSSATSPSDCPFDRAIQAAQHDAWRRGFHVGHTIDRWSQDGPD